MTPIIDAARRRWLLLAGAALPLVSFAQSGWPARPVRIVLPFPPGGQTDAVVRYFAQKLEAALGQPVFVENKPGASSLLGTQFVAHAPADGYTLLFSQTAMVSNMVLQSNANYDAFRDFAPVHRTYENYAVLAVAGNSPYTTLARFVAAAKAAATPMSYGTSGHASSSHYFIALLAKQAGLELTHVPYRGESALIPDLMGNRLQAGVVSGSTARQFSDGRLRMLAVSGNERVSLLPDLPTFKELGYQGIGNESFAGFFAPAGTPRDVIDRLNAELNRISSLPETRERMAAQAIEPTPPSSPADFLVVMRRAHEEWVRNRKLVDIVPS